MKKIKNPFTAKAKAQRLVNKQNKLQARLKKATDKKFDKAMFARIKQNEVAGQLGKTTPNISKLQVLPSEDIEISSKKVNNRKPNMKRPEAPLQNGKELKPIMIKPNMGRIIKPMAKFPDLSGDGKVTKKDILMGRGVINKPKMKKNNKSKTEANVMKGVTISTTDPMKDALLEAKRQGKNALKLMRQGDVEGAKAANELKMIAARQAKDIEFARLKGGTIDRLTLR